MAGGRLTLRASSVVVWPNEDGSWTLSHRSVDGTTEPELVGDREDSDPGVDASGAVSIVATLSSGDGDDAPAVATFTRPLEPDYETSAETVDLQREINQQVIFAYGETNPGDKAQDATIKQHKLDAMGVTYFDLSKEFDTGDEGELEDAPLVPAKTSAASASATSTATSGSDTEESDGSSATSTAAATQASDSDSATREESGLSTLELLKYHGIMACIAWLFFSPLAVLIASGMRAFGKDAKSRTWFKTHVGLQAAVTVPLTLAAVGVAVYAVEKSSFEWSYHRVSGIGNASGRRARLMKD